MKKILILLFAVALTTIASAQSKPLVRYTVIIEQVQPTSAEQNLLKAEQAKHPRIAASIDQLRNTYADLQKAPDDFGGHKAQAIDAVHQAIISLRKALYYKVYVEDGNPQ